MEVDKKMGIDVYEQIPVMESEKFLLREIKDGDAEDLLRVYSDKDAVPLFNSDNCVNGFYYTSIEEMKDTIAFWKREYQNILQPDPVRWLQPTGRGKTDLSGSRRKSGKSAGSSRKFTYNRAGKTGVL